MSALGKYEIHAHVCGVVYLSFFISMIRLHFLLSTAQDNLACIEPFNCILYTVTVSV